MNHAAISCDVVSSTSLSVENRESLTSNIKDLIKNLTEKFHKEGFYGRVSQGDHIECAMNSPEIALRAALLIKTYVKSENYFSYKDSKGKQKHFKDYGVRMAVAVAPLEKIDPKNDIIDGEAIFLAGRAIDDFKTSDKKKVIIKNTFVFVSRDKYTTDLYNSMFWLLDHIISNCSSKQSEVIYYKLFGKNESEISDILGKWQSTINQHSTAAGWNAIHKAVEFYENTIK